MTHSTLNKSGYMCISNDILVAKMSCMYMCHLAMFSFYFISTI